MNINIEIPEIKDYEVINKIAVQVHNLHVNWRPDIFVSCDEIISKEDLLEMINSNAVFVAKNDDKIVGYICFNIKSKVVKGFRDRKQLNIEAMGVDENIRNQGIGTKLLEHVKKYALENDCTDIYLTVNEENENAIDLYEKFGMKIKNIAYSMQI